MFERSGIKEYGEVNSRWGAGRRQWKFPSSSPKGEEAKFPGNYKKDIKVDLVWNAGKLSARKRRPV